MYSGGRKVFTDDNNNKKKNKYISRFVQNLKKSGFCAVRIKIEDCIVLRPENVPTHHKIQRTKSLRALSGYEQNEQTLEKKKKNQRIRFIRADT